MIYNLSRLAKVDLTEIWYYSYFNWGKFQADKYQDQIYEGLNKISRKFDLKNEITNLDFKYFRFKVNHHFIYYSIKDNAINVSRILHEKMDFERHLKFV